MTTTTTTVVAATTATLAGIVAYCIYHHHRQHTTTATVQRLTTLLAAERKGRTSAERQLAARTRNQQQQHINHSSTTATTLSATHRLPVFTFTPVAFARTLFVDRRGCPRQGSLTPTAVGWLDICKHVPRAAFEGLAQFSHVWVTFVFDRNTNVHKASAVERTFKAKVRPPLLGGKKVGLFATRSPHRPNPVGLTLCRLDRVDMPEGRLYLSGIDLCDGTAVLDIKPYVCHDRPEATTLKYAAWVPSRDQASSKPLEVRFQPRALVQLKELLPRLHRTSRPSRVYYPDVATAVQCLSEVLRLDIRGLNQKRGADGTGLYSCRLGDIGVQFDVRDGAAWVERVQGMEGSGEKE